MAYGNRRRGRRDYDNTDRGVLFENDDKRSKKHPDMRGNINVDGREYWLSGWWQQHDRHGEYLSLSVQPKEEQRRSRGDGRGRRRPSPARRHIDEEQMQAPLDNDAPWDRGADEPPDQGNEDDYGAEW